jgi:hypothetical protein
VPIIRRNNCIYAKLGTCYSVFWCAHTGHPYRITSAKCHINTVVSPDDGHTVARNMQRKEINILRKIVHQVGFIYKIIYSDARSTKHKTKEQSCVFRWFIAMNKKKSHLAFFMYVPCIKYSLLSRTANTH